MRNKIIKIGLILIVGCGIAAGFVYIRKKEKSTEEVREIRPWRGDIQSRISTTATVLPRNRLEIKPPVSGRVEKILVQEGDIIKAGETLAWMSSTERAALLDAAKGKGDESSQYWEDIYKPIPLISPIDGEVIVAKTQPGQSVTVSDAVLVVSDHLIVRAQVDETDIGKVRQGQDATVTLDAYPDTQIKAKVEHIYYESKTVNNVTTYEVDVIPDTVPDFFRSGMNATVNFIIAHRENALLLPHDFVIHDKEGVWVLKKNGNGQAVRSKVETGISGEKNIEILSGLSDGDTVIAKSSKYELPTDKTGTNPFMPSRPKK